MKNLTSKKSKGMQLNGNLITGDTFPVKDTLKKFCDAKWDSDYKGWRVDIAKLDEFTSIGNSIGLHYDNSVTVTETNANNGLCPKCGTYCYGDCTTN